MRRTFQARRADVFRAWTDPRSATSSTFCGVYREVRPPEKLVYTWRWERPDMDIGETLVTVEFRELGRATEVVEVL